MANNQPRQPKDMKGLLKFCFEATKGEDVGGAAAAEAFGGRAAEAATVVD